MVLTTGSLPAGLDVTFELVVTVRADVAHGTVLETEATVTESSLDLRPENNRAAASVTTGAAMPEFSSDVLRFEEVAVTRTPQPTSLTFGMINRGDATLTFAFDALERIGADVDAGKVTTPDDRSLFRVEGVAFSSAVKLRARRAARLHPHVRPTTADPRGPHERAVRKSTPAGGHHVMARHRAARLRSDGA